MVDRSLVQGTCFVDAMKVCVSVGGHSGNEEVQIVHGLLFGDAGAGGRRFWHAWVEAYGRVWVLENGAVRVLDRDWFYCEFEVEHVWTFTFDEADERFVELGHAGPWVGDGPHDWEQLLRRLYPEENTEFGGPLG